MKYHERLHCAHCGKQEESCNCHHCQECEGDGEVYDSENDTCVPCEACAGSGFDLARSTV